MMDVETITSYGDLARNPRLTDGEVDRVAELLLRHGLKTDWLIARLPRRLLEEKGIEPVDGTRQIIHGRIARETKKAYCVAIGRDEVWLPKSQLTIFEHADGAEIRVPQRGLSEFEEGEV